MKEKRHDGNAIVHYNVLYIIIQTYFVESRGFIDINKMMAEKYNYLVFLNYFLNV